MVTVINFIDENFENIEKVSLTGVDLKESLEMISKVNDFVIGTEKLRHEKTGWVGVDFRKNEIEIMVKDPGQE